MTNDQVPVDESEEGKRKPQRNMLVTKIQLQHLLKKQKKKNTMKKEMVEQQTRQVLL